MEKLATKELRSTLKGILTGYRSINDKNFKKLYNLGFILKRANNHYVLEYKNGRNVIISKTASDGRSGLNLVSKIIHIVED